MDIIISRIGDTATLYPSTVETGGSPRVVCNGFGPDTQTLTATLLTPQGRRIAHADITRKDGGALDGILGTRTPEAKAYTEETDSAVGQGRLVLSDVAGNTVLSLPVRLVPSPFWGCIDTLPPPPTQTPVVQEAFGGLAEPAPNASMNAVKGLLAKVLRILKGGTALLMLAYIGGCAAPAYAVPPEPVAIGDAPGDMPVYDAPAVRALDRQVADAAAEARALKADKTALNAEAARAKAAEADAVAKAANALTVANTAKQTAGEASRAAAAADGKAANALQVANAAKTAAEAYDSAAVTAERDRAMAAEAANAAAVTNAVARVEAVGTVAETANTNAAEAKHIAEAAKQTVGTASAFASEADEKAQMALQKAYDAVNRADVAKRTAGEAKALAGNAEAAAGSRVKNVNAYFPGSMADVSAACLMEWPNPYGETPAEYVRIGYVEYGTGGEWYLGYFKGNPIAPLEKLYNFTAEAAASKANAQAAKDAQTVAGAARQAADSAAQTAAANTSAISALGTSKADAAALDALTATVADKATAADLSAETARALAAEQALGAEIRAAGWLTDTAAASKYQPKGDYTTTADLGGYISATQDATAAANAAKATADGFSARITAAENRVANALTYSLRLRDAYEQYGRHITLTTAFATFKQAGKKTMYEDKTTQKAGFTVPEMRLGGCWWEVESISGPTLAEPAKAYVVVYDRRDTPVLVYVSSEESVNKWTLDSANNGGRHFVIADVFADKTMSTEALSAYRSNTDAAGVRIYFSKTAPTGTSASAQARWLDTNGITYTLGRGHQPNLRTTPDGSHRPSFYYGWRWTLSGQFDGAPEDAFGTIANDLGDTVPTGHPDAPFAPAQHRHSISDIDGLEARLRALETK